MSLHPIDGIVRVRQGATLIAESRAGAVPSETVTRSW